MKLTVKKKHILDVLSKIQGLTGRKSSLAITSNILVRTLESGITLVATDLETGFEGTYPATVESDGSIAINARKFFEIVRDFPSEDIHINEVENHWIQIGNRNVEYHIVGMNPEDFPEIPKISDIPFFDVNSADLSRMIERSVMISGSTDDQRAHIIGALYESLPGDDGQRLIRIVSTDGTRLSKTDVLCREAADLPAGSCILIPKKGLVEMNRFIEAEGNTSIGLKDNHFIVRKNAETIMIRLLEGEFPDYSGIIEKKDGSDILVDKHLFTMMLKRMSILASDSYKAVIFSFSSDKLVINSTNPDIGESKEDMAIDYGGKAFEVAFNPKYFIDALNAIDEDSVLMHVVDEERPCFLQGEQHSDFLSVIMPMRL